MAESGANLGGGGGYGEQLDMLHITLYNWFSFPELEKSGIFAKIFIPRNAAVCNSVRCNKIGTVRKITILIGYNTWTINFSKNLKENNIITRHQYEKFGVFNRVLVYDV